MEYTLNNCPIFRGHLRAPPGSGDDLFDNEDLLPATAFQELSQLPQLHLDRVLMRCRDAGVEADARERADLAFGVAKNPIARVSILARVSGPSRGRFWHGHNLYLLAMTVAVVSEVQVPKNGCFIAAEAVPGVTPGWSHTDP